MIHRDIKPANIFLVPKTGGFQTKLLDFGLAKSVDSKTQLTQTGVKVGTPAYMSPEQTLGQDLDVRSDLYSFAAVMYEALTERRVVQGEGVANLLLQVLKTMPPRVSRLLPGMPAAVDEAFEAALAKLPEDRPADLEVWASGLAALLESVPESAGAATEWPQAALEPVPDAQAGVDGDAPTTLSLGAEPEET